MKSYKDLLEKYSDMGKIANIPLEERKKDLAYLNKIANKNMKDLEKKGYTEWAYKMAKTDLQARGKEKFTLSRNANKRETNSGLIDVVNFLSAKSHNISGYNKLIREHEAMFKKHGIDLNAKYTDDNGEEKKFDKDKFFEFLASDEWRGTKNTKGLKAKLDSGQVFGVLRNVIMSEEFTTQDLLHDFEKYVNSEIAWNNIEAKYGKAEWLS